MVVISKSSEKLGKQIKKYRRERGYTQEELAEKVDISRAHMGHIEQGRKKPSLDLLEDISRALKIKARDLIPF